MSLSRRTPLRRKSRLRGGGSLARTGPIRRRNPERLARRRQIQFHSEDYTRWIRSLACSVPGCWRTNIDPAHVVKRSRGLKRSTWRDIIPLCRLHHGEQEGRNREFEERYRLDLTSIAAAVVQRWETGRL